MEETNHQEGTSMNLEVTDNNLYLFLPGKIARMIQICPVTVLIHTAVLQTSQPNCGIMVPQPCMKNSWKKKT